MLECFPTVWRDFHDQQFAPVWSTVEADNFNIYNVKEEKCTTTTWRIENLDIIIDNIINKEKNAMIDDIINKKKADDNKKMKENNNNKTTRYIERIDKTHWQRSSTTMTSTEVKYKNDIDRGQVQQWHRQRSSTTMTSTEVKYNNDIDRGQVKYNNDINRGQVHNDIDRGQVQQVHRKSTSKEVKFIKFIEKIENDIGKKNVTTTSIKNKEFDDNID